MTKQARRLRPLRWIASGIAALVAGPLLGVLLGGSLRTVFVVAGFAAFLVCVRRAPVLWKVDEIVFEQEKKLDPGSDERRHPAVAALVFTLLTGNALAQQQTIVDVPSAGLVGQETPASPPTPSPSPSPSAKFYGWVRTTTFWMIPRRPPRST